MGWSRRAAPWPIWRRRSLPHPQCWAATPFEGDRTAHIEYLLGSLRRLAGDGADFAAMTADMPHIVFNDLATCSPVPLVSIVEVCAQKARQRGLGRLPLLSTLIHNPCQASDGLPGGSHV